MKIRMLVTSNAGTYMVTITQFTPRAYVKTLKRTDWTIAFNVSSMPTMTHSQTKPSAPGRRVRRAASASRARNAVIRSPNPIIVRNSVGTPAATAPGARIVPPTVRNAWTQSSGTSASFLGNRDNLGATYQNAMSEYATKLKVN